MSFENFSINLDILTKLVDIGGLDDTMFTPPYLIGGGRRILQAEGIVVVLDPSRDEKLMYIHFEGLLSGFEALSFTGTTPRDGDTLIGPHIDIQTATYTEVDGTEMDPDEGLMKLVLTRFG